MDKAEKSRRINCNQNNKSHRAKIRKITADQNLLARQKKRLIEEHEANLKY